MDNENVWLVWFFFFSLVQILRMNVILLCNVVLGYYASVSAEKDERLGCRQKTLIQVKKKHMHFKRAALWRRKKREQRGLRMAEAVSVLNLGKDFLKIGLILKLEKHQGWDIKLCHIL